MDEETLKTLCISFVSQLVGANVIRKEDLLNICSEECSTFGGDIQTNEAKTKKRVRDYLNSVNGTSNQNLGNWCRKTKLNVTYTEHLNGVSDWASLATNLSEVQDIIT